MTTPERRRAAIPVPVTQDTPAWIDARRDVIGSSDVSILTGNGVYGSSPVDLWAYKTRLLEAVEPDAKTRELWDLGHALEPAIAGRYTALVSRPVRNVTRLLVHPTIPFAGASLDRVSAVRGERRIVELKWAPHRRWTDGPDPVPPHVQDQVQWQLLVTGYDVADVAVLNGSRVEVHEVGPDGGYQNDLLYIVRDFWRYIELGERPPIDGSEATRRALVRLRPRDNGLALDPVPAELEALMAEWPEAANTAKLATEYLERVKNTVRAILDDYAEAESEGWRVTYRKQREWNKVDWRMVASSYRRLLDLVDSELSTEGVTHTTLEALSSLDAIVALYSTPREGNRPLVPTWKGQPASTEEDTAWT